MRKPIDVPAAVAVGVLAALGLAWLLWSRLAAAFAQNDVRKPPTNVFKDWKFN